MSIENPRKWRFTWEAQSHSPTLKLFLFDSLTNPSIHCNSLDVRLNLSQCHLLVSWIEDEAKVSLRVPIPKVLIDHDSPLSFRALEDHIEVKLVLLLPVDHPIVSCFDSFLKLSDEAEHDEALDASKPLEMDSDLKRLSLRGGVHFYCRNCSSRLTVSPLRHFVEMPSVNWREVADNWFGGCCCSFGGISEELVNRYASAYTCSRGVCLLNSTTVTISGDDLIGCKFPDGDGSQKHKPKQDFTCVNGLHKEDTPDFGSDSGNIANCFSPSVRIYDGKLSTLHNNFENLGKNLQCKVGNEENNVDTLCTLLASDFSVTVASRSGCHDSACHNQYCTEFGMHDVPQTSLVEEKIRKVPELVENQKSFLNGFLGNVFVAKAYNLSMDIKWKQFFCPKCSHLLGAYPCDRSDLPVDEGVRFFKCYLSTALPIGGSSDLFRKYSLERMFTNQLVDSAKDELSYRTVVRDLTTRSPMLQVVLLNPNSWCCSGFCLNAENTVESISKLDLCPIVKVLFSDCSKDAETQLRVLEDWSAGNLADEVFILAPLIEDLIEIMTTMRDELPPSCTSLQGLFVSSMQR